MIIKPPIENIHHYRSRIIGGEDGDVGLVVFLYPSLQMWDNKVVARGVATWVLLNTIVMCAMLALPHSMEAEKSTILEYNEDANVIIISVHYGNVHVFLVQLGSMQCKKPPCNLDGKFLLSICKFLCP